MTGKTLKSVLCVVMSLVLVVGCIVPAFAKANVCTKDDVPVLIIAGFSQYPLINTKTGEGVWAPEVGAILDAVGRALPVLQTLLSSNKTQDDYDAFCDEFFPIGIDLLSPISCTPDGEPADKDVGLLNQFTGPVSDYNYDDVKACFENDIVDIAVNAYGADHVWVYGLDWRVDPLVLADDINDYVQTMKATTGHDKVAVSAISMGGCVLASYLEKYGCEDLTNITMLSSAFTGLEMVGSLFTGEISIDEQGLYNIINESIGTTALSDVLSSTGILKSLIPVVDDLFKYEGDRVYSELLIPIFGYITGFWAFLPAARYDEAKAYMAPRMNEGTTEQVEKFWARTDYYHNNVQGKIADILTAAQEKGVTVSIVSNYNKQMPPISKSSVYTGDQVIETMHTSGYATVANYGETLGDDYPMNSHVSYDNMIDASTCILPDNTWFIKNQAHVEFSNQGENDNSRFYAFILTAPAGTDIYTNPEFPQFMKYDSSTHTLSPLAGTKGDVDNNGKISVLDAKLVLKDVAGVEKLAHDGAWSADMNLDGKVTILDAKLILKSVANA